MNPDSTAGMDGYTSQFFQSCWHTIKNDLIEAVVDFFNGNTMPKYFTSSAIVLIPKKENPVSWNDFRPISLCTFFNKLTSKIITLRLGSFLPSMISLNQTAFVKGRLISDNILLAQEMVNDLNMKVRGGNMFFKLDISKAYDNISWEFIYKVLDLFGFSDQFIRLIKNSVDNVWFSILLNGGSNGFFHSKHGLRQGDPLSPSLFIITMEYFSRCINFIFEKYPSMYYLTKDGFPVSHLCFADDFMIFCNGSLNHIKKIKSFLNNFFLESGLSINNLKSSFFTSKHFTLAKINRISSITHFIHQSLPFKYLGAPIFRGLKKSHLFDEIIQKMIDRISSWEFQFLSYGGRLTVLKSILNSMAFHLFQVIQPNIATVLRLERILNKFFWGSRNNVTRMHWTSWSKLCGPLNEGGLGCKSISDSIIVSSMKMWWNFRKNESLWASFMNFKYCKGKHPLCCFYKHGDSSIWKRLCQTMKIMEPLIAWGLNSGNCFFWQDNWMFEGSIESLLSTCSVSALKVKQFYHDNNWDMQSILSLVPLDIGYKIKDLSLDNQKKDHILFKLSYNGNFVFKVAWDFIREKKDISIVFKRIWSNNIPTSFSILTWRIIKGYIPVDVVLWKKGFFLPSKCYCCYHIEDINHVFINGPIAAKVWIWFDNFFNTNYFSGHLSFNHFLTVICHNTTLGHIKVVTAISLIWFLWMDRNDAKHRNIPMNHNRIIARTKEKINSLYKVNLLNQKQFRGFKFVANKLNTNIFDYIHEPCFKFVIWKKPNIDYIKVNTDGSVFDNNYGCGGIIRNYKGNLIVAFSSPINKCSVLYAELMAIYKALQLCLSSGYFKIWLEVDAILVINCLAADYIGNFDTFYILKDIKKMLSHLDYKISHIWREGNSAADFLAKNGAKLHQYTLFYNNDIPFILRGLINLDKSGLPYIRH
ncbi:Putative ribonuclease H protein [Dendrobium catenatum]|uniref:Ribonuclease H protein n=1 Tax=Dendrobium catenatum TaxID=906689 RepID=A0A2I0WN90_9ASPA|nr:Putative ribonuclease H protein [Dendrobium catenatum]